MGAPVPVNSARAAQPSRLVAPRRRGERDRPAPRRVRHLPEHGPAAEPGPGHPRVAPPTTTAAPATTATTAPVPVDDEAQVRAVIDTYWQEWTIAMAEADPARPGLLATLDGDARWIASSLNCGPAQPLARSR